MDLVILIFYMNMHSFGNQNKIMKNQNHTTGPVLTTLASDFALGDGEQPVPQWRDPRRLTPPALGLLPSAAVHTFPASALPWASIFPSFREAPEEKERASLDQ